VGYLGWGWDTVSEGGYDSDDMEIRPLFCQSALPFPVMSEPTKAPLYPIILLFQSFWIRDMSS
jgi:hypothetical protein